jgi:hypothetical protein
MHFVKRSLHIDNIKVVIFDKQNVHDFVHTNFILAM